MDMELIGVEDIFENDELTVMKSKYKLEGGYLFNTDIGIKSGDGEIEEIITVKSDLIIDLQER